MRDCILFEIPIYSTTEEEFDKRWEKHFIKFSNNGVDDKTLEMYKNYCFPKQLWIYNQIIGYVVIYYEKNSVYFDGFISNKRTRYDSHKKSLMCLEMPAVYHFAVYKEYTNKDIANKIKYYLDDFYNSCLKTKFLYTKNFDVIYKNINYLKIFKEKGLWEQ